MIREHDLVVLTCDIDKHNLVKGDVGTVVHCYADGEAYEVEFVTSSGDTIAVLTLEREDIRPISEHEILHVRELVAV